MLMSKQNLIRRHAASKIRDFSDRLLGPAYTIFSAISTWMIAKPT